MNELINKQQKILSLLVVEDSEEDYVTFLRIIRKLGFQYPIYHCFDGDEALDFLFHQGEYLDPETAPRPTIILMDLNLPGTDGRDVIEIIKNNGQLRSIPLVVFSTSSNPQDIKVCYDYGVNSYMQKPVNLKSLSKSIEDFLNYWFETVILPDD